MGAKRPVRKPKTGRPSATRRGPVLHFRNAKLIGGNAQVLALGQASRRRPAK